MSTMPSLATSPPSPRVRSAARSWAYAAACRPSVAACAVFCAYAVITIVLTWPLAAHLNSGVTSRIDPVSSIWRLGWTQHQLLHHPLHLFDGNIFYPYPRSYLFDGLEFGAAILTLPLALFALSPLAIYNSAVLLALALSGLAMYLLARHFGAPFVAAFVAGAIYAFAPMHLDRIGHVAFLCSAGFSLILLFLDRLIARPRWGDALALAACLVLQALSTQYYAIYLAFFVPLFLGVMLLRNPAARRWSVWAHVLPAALLAAVVVAPVALAYRQVQVQYGVQRSYDQVTYYAATLTSFFTTDERNLLWGGPTAVLRAQGTYTFERGMFPGLTALVLAGVGLWHGRRRAWEQFLGALVAMGAALSLGPVLRLTPDSKAMLLRHLPYDILFWHLPGFDSMRAPARFGVLFLLGIAGLAATGATALARGLASVRWLRLLSPQVALVVVYTLVFVGLGAEYAEAPLKLFPLESGAAIPPEYRWLAGEREATVVELPLVIPDHAREQQIAAREQYFSLYHGHPLVNGIANVLPKGYKALVLDLQRFPSSRSIALLQGLGITDIVVHLDEFDAGRGADVTRALDAGWEGLSLAFADGETRIYRLAPSDAFAQLRAAIPADASVVLSRADPLGTGAYMAMLGYALWPRPLYARLGVEFGTAYRGTPETGGRYDYALLYRGEDLTALGIVGAKLVWQDSEASAYQLVAPWP